MNDAVATPARPRPRWAEAPTAPPVERSEPSAVALGVVIATVGPVVRAVSLPDGRPLHVVAVGGIAALAVLGTTEAAWRTRLALAVVAAAVLVRPQGLLIAGWIAGGLLLAPWLVQSRPPLPLPGRRRHEALAPSVALVAVAAWLGADPARSWQVAPPLALAFALPLVVPRFGAPITRVLGRFGAAVGRGGTSALFSLVGALALTVPWVGHRLLRFDPLPVRDGWSARDRVDVLPAEPWARVSDPRPVRRRRPPRRRAATALAAVTAVLVVALGVAAVTWRSEPTERERAIDRALGADSDDRPAAHRDDAWYPGHVEDVEWLLGKYVAYRPFEIYRLLDARTRTVDVADGYRRSWRPPACDGCRRVTVWLYGGDAVFGFGQRDGHTIASELARVAAERGLPVDVANRGVPGTLHWRSATRFANDLAIDPRPDLVVFYEGAEEVESAEVLERAGTGDMYPPHEPSSEELYRELAGVPDTPENVPEGAQAVGRPVSAPRSPDEVGRFAVQRYERSLGMSDDTAEFHRLDVRYFWQPSAATRPEGEPDVPTDAAARTSAAAARAAAAALPGRVTDLSDVLDDVRGPLFTTQWHHNERGARKVAEALFDELEPQLRSAAAGGGT